ncbi:Hypothetical_protein [Hexamita inflata]|uniref:Hypothetical_protein n=1 Tax=Hexamita inflata TaxID=28002 RepID=A0AA86QL69_9EUKA|nr:Hypothetical protein HINF_LOCUS41425 [Hexamita inflata]
MKDKTTSIIQIQNDSLNCTLIISTKAQFNHSIFISQIMTIHKSKLSYTQRYHKLISTSYLIFQDCHSEQLPQTTQVSSALELTLLTSEVIFVTIFGMAGMNLWKRQRILLLSLVRGTMLQLQYLKLYNILKCHNKQLNIKQQSLYKKAVFSNCNFM